MQKGVQMKNSSITLAESVLEVLIEEFGASALNSLQFSGWKGKSKISSFLEENGEGFKLEGNGLGIWLEENGKIYYADFTSKDVSVLEANEEYPVLYSGTDIINYNRIIYMSENGLYANYDHNRQFYFDGSNYPSEVVDEWID